MCLVPKNNNGNIYRHLYDHTVAPVSSVFCDKYDYITMFICIDI